jgi:hypothetical protein
MRFEESELHGASIYTYSYSPFNADAVPGTSSRMHVYDFPRSSITTTSLFVVHTNFIIKYRKRREKFL